MSELRRPVWLAPKGVPPGYWDGWADATQALRKQLEQSVEHVSFLGLAADGQRVHPADRHPIEVARDALAVILEDCRRGDLEVLDRCRLLIDADPDAASEAMQLLIWIVADKLAELEEATPRA